MFVCITTLYAHRGRKKVWDPLRQELQMLVSHHPDAENKIQAFYKNSMLLIAISPIQSMDFLI